MRFSRRIPEDWTPAPWPALAEKVRLLGRDSCVDLTLSSPLAAGFSVEESLFQSAFQQFRPWRHWTPEPHGSLTARSAIAKWMELRGEHCLEDELLLTPGTSDAYSILFRVLCDPGNSILVPRPGYPLLDVLASLDHINCEGYALRFIQGLWRIDWASLNHASQNTRAVLVVNPGNPTGSVLASAEWLQLAELCEQRGWSLIVDEVFSLFPFESSQPIPWQEITRRVPVFRLNGLSKTVGLPQIKLSWLLVLCPSHLRESLWNALEYVADAFLGVSALAECLVPDLLEQQSSFQSEVMDRLRVNFLTAQQILGTVADCLPPPQGGWYFCAHFPDIDDEQCALALAETYGVLVHPGYFFDFAEDGWLVMSLLPESERFSKGIQAIVRLLRGE
ncbi:MAG TPA: pyridoxal phosphate-dependent aminotransferase [Fibrobacteraceae bacterium]|nr:pyridoxal phosphate-dependent aminotransferase [Fibrobacteraceae bacterium]